MPEWLVEEGIGEARAVLADAGEIVEARIELHGTTPAGSIIAARLAAIGSSGRNAVAVGSDGSEYLLPQGAAGVTQGAALTIEVTREAIPGAEPWKRPIARLTSEPAAAVPPLAARLGARTLTFPAPCDELQELGWEDVLDEARSGIVAFTGGELRISATPAMTLIDVDGHLPAADLAVLGASAAARAVRRLDIGGSVGIDLPTAGSKAARQEAGAAIDAELPPPFERTAVNGFGFVQIVRPRARASLVEIAYDRPAFEARALLRRACREGAGSKLLVAHPSVLAVLERRSDWTDALARQVGGEIRLRPDEALPMSGGYAASL